ncbi:MAG: hypothetical protein KDA21_07505 [Phycisphaerales bacterium]|nr:hypothetical protein [Phycisphaerales bacterium]
MSPAAARVVRCWVEPALALLAALALTLWWLVADAALVRLTTITGWIIAALFAFFLLNIVREPLLRLAHLPARAWYRIHAWLGLLAGLLVLIHTGGHLPQGTVEVVVTLFFLLTFIAGLVGLWISRAIPARLATIPNPVEPDGIPQQRREIRQAVEAVVLRHVENTGDDAIAAAYERDLRAYFDAPQRLWLHFVNTTRARRELELRLRARQRRLNEAAQPTFAEIRDFAFTKADLDERTACHAFHNAWLGVHLVLSVILVLLLVLHAAISLTWSGGGA